jgi:hypothetical protein
VDMIVARKKSQNEYETSHFGGACNNHATDETTAAKKRISRLRAIRDVLFIG